MEEEKGIERQDGAPGADVNSDEIDLIEIIKRLWSKRAFIIKVICCFILFGILVALFSAKEYTAGCVVVPQTGQKSGSSSISSLAALAGISLSNMGGGDILSPLVYSNVVNNTNLKKDLMYTKVYFEEFGKEITLLDYYTNKEYQKFSLLGTIKKYTIGLPGLIIGLFRDSAEIALPDNTRGESILSLSINENTCAKILSGITSIDINDKKGYISISASMPEPLAAAAVAEAYMRLLEKYVIEFKTERAKANYEFVKQRYDEAKEAYEKAQIAYAEFRDANRAFSSAVASIKEEQVKNDYNLAYSLYSELSRQLIQAELSVKEDTPILTVIEPVVVPVEKSKPRRAMIIVTFTFLGAICVSGCILGLDYLKKNFDIAWLRKWE